MLFFSFGNSNRRYWVGRAWNGRNAVDAVKYLL